MDNSNNSSAVDVALLALQIQAVKKYAAKEQERQRVRTMDVDSYIDDLVFACTNGR